MKSIVSTAHYSVREVDSLVSLHWISVSLYIKIKPLSYEIAPSYTLHKSEMLILFKQIIFFRRKRTLLGRKRQKSAFTFQAVISLLRERVYQLPKRSHPYYNYFCPVWVCYFGPNVQAIYYNPSTKIRKIAINFSGGWTNGTYTCVKGEPRPPILKVNFCFGRLNVV